ISVVLGEGALQDVISLVAGILSRSTFDGAFELVPHTVHGLCGERQIFAIEFAGFEEQIEKLATIAFRFAIARDKAGHVAFVLDRELHKLAVLQKRIHAGVIVGGLWGGGIWRRILSIRKHASQEQSGDDEIRSDHVRIKAWKAGSMWARASTWDGAWAPVLQLGLAEGQ